MAKQKPYRRRDYSAGRSFDPFDPDRDRGPRVVFTVDLSSRMSNGKFSIHYDKVYCSYVEALSIVKDMLPTVEEMAMQEVRERGVNSEQRSLQVVDPPNGGPTNVSASTASRSKKRSVASGGKATALRPVSAGS